mmetsp:Transcript_8276/g.24822  ORF Transcript_8276/g.24822 Transcript_8276/m.24822 type:complete len:312 (+) Transcript_8276:251-1186(+)
MRLLVLVLICRCAALQPPKRLLAVGELLYDSLPNGLFLGGAPLNVMVHAAQLGASSAYCSATGDDQLGRDARRRLEAKGVDTMLVQTRPELETGFVSATIDENGDATYEIAHPSAWDDIHEDPSLRAAARSVDCLVHGSLALRGPASAATIRTLASEAQRRVFDINLRPMPAGMDSRALIEPLLSGCYVIKCNEEELETLKAWWDLPDETLEETLTRVGDRTEAEYVVVTRAGEGAALVDKCGGYVEAPGVKVDVVDTVGSGDAFCAQLVVGLLSGTAPGDALAQATRYGSWVATQAGATPALDPVALAAL